MTRQARSVGWGLALVGFLSLSWWCWQLSSDIDDPGDTDLILERTPGVAAQDNAWAGFAEALAAATAADPEWATRSDGSPSEVWDAALLASDAGALTLERLAEAVARPALQFPRPGEADPVTPELLDLASLLDLRSRLHAESGDVDAAFADALRTIQMGERLATGEGVTLVSALLGTRIQELGFARVRTLLEVPEADATRLGEWLHKMGDDKIPEEARRRIWAGEYEGFKTSFLDGLREKQEEVPFYLRSPHQGYFFQVNRTLSKIAQGFRDLRDSQSSCGGGPHPDPEPMRTVDYVRPNAVGEILARVAAPDYSTYLEHFCALEVRRQATRSVTALRAFRHQHGREAESLDSLVPTYLATVPVDPFDGEALRYSRDAKRVWSVGRDRIDAGGESATQDHDHLDEIVVPTELDVDVAGL